MLCEQCRALFHQIEEGLKNGQIQPGNLEGTASSGCCICVSLLDYVSSYKGKDIYESGLELSWSLMDPREHQETIELHFTLISSSYGYIHWCSFSFRDPPQPSPTDLATPNISPVEDYRAPVNSSDTSLASLVQSWLRACVDEHMGSGTGQDTSYRPPRLLYIDLGTLRLIRGSVCPKNSEWATLSHCWGPNPDFITLTSENLSQFELDIPLDSLPPTFRDTVKFCESIGIKYVWIDSLCIVQQGEGSKEDWSHHVTEMRQVYQNTTLNLAADWASSAQDGLFRDRDIVRIKRPVVQFQSGPLQGRWQLGYDSELLTLFSNSPLGSRAWVVQKRFLSHRMVSFSENQVYWRCNHQPYYKSEQFPEGLDPSVGQPMLCTSLFMEHENKTIFDAYKGKDPTREFVFIRSLNEAAQYSTRSLTYPDADKFAAFAGVAENYAHLFKEDYIAGFFKRHLPWALAWMVQKPIPLRILRSSASPYRAPSWSWAIADHETESSIAHCFFDPDMDEPIELSQVTKICLELVDPESKFGPLLHASLELRAALIEVAWHAENGNSGEVTLKSQIGDETIAYFDSVEDFHSDQKSTRLVPLRACSGFAEPESFSIYFLILRRVPGSTSPTYVRIGVGVLVHSEHSVIDVLKSFATEEIELI